MKIINKLPNRGRPLIKDARLTKAQEQIVKDMQSGWCLWTDEGYKFKAWLGDDKGFKYRGVRVDTVQSLFNKGVIKLDESEYPQQLFKYILTERYLNS